MSLKQREEFLTHLYSSDQPQAYDIVKGLMDEVELLTKQLQEAKKPNQVPHAVSRKHFFEMVSQAIQKFSKEPFPVILEREPIESGHAAHLFMIEAFVAYCIKNELIKKPITFDYRR